MPIFSLQTTLAGPKKIRIGRARHPARTAALRRALGIRAVGHTARAQAPAPKITRVKQEAEQRAEAMAAQGIISRALQTGARGQAETARVARVRHPRAESPRGLAREILT